MDGNAFNNFVPGFGKIFVFIGVILGVGFILGIVIGTVTCSWQMEVVPHLPTPPCPNCQCGCTVTGQCVCKDCDHPLLTPKGK